MRKYSTVIAILVLFIASGSVLAQEDEARDVLETCFYGGFGIPSGGITDFGGNLGAKTGWSAGMDIGYFMRYNLVVGVNFIYTQMAVDGGPEVDGLYHRLYNPNLYAKYYFTGESNFEPYIKAHIGVENPKFTTYLQLPDPKYHATSYDASLAYGFGAGLFYYSADYSGIFVEVNYHAAQTKDAKRVWDEQTAVFGENLAMIDIHAGIRILISSGD